MSNKLEFKVLLGIGPHLLLLDTVSKLDTHGPFNYVRHPLYATLLFTIPPILIACFSDLMFLFTWVIIFVLSHFIINMEEQILVKKFGEDYKNYQRFVPALIPYKGAAGRRYREYCHVSAPKINKKDYISLK